VTIRDALRTAVLATNPYWPFSIVNKYPYYLAIERFTRLCARQLPIKSIYLRSGMVERAWVPALSDIDFMVVIDSGTGNDDEFAQLQNFWRRFASLKKLFPMIGEVEILNNGVIHSWTQFGFTGHMASKWRLLKGTAAIPQNSAADSRRFSRDCLHYTLHWMEWYTRSYFAGKFFARDENSALLRRDLARLASKIFRSLQHIAPESGKYDRLEQACSDEHELCARIIEVMEAAIRSTNAADQSTETEDERVQWNSQFVTERNPALEQTALDQSIFARWADVLESAFFDFNDQLYLVFRDGRASDSRAACLNALRQPVGRAAKNVTAVSHTVFTYLLTQYLPFEYVHLLRHRKLAFGADIVPEIAPPPRSAFAEFLLGQVPNVLGFAQSRQFHGTANAHESASILERGLLLRLWLEHDFIAPARQNPLDEYERCYPDEMQMLRALRSGAVSPNDRQGFERFKMLAETIHAQLAAVH